LNEDAASAFVRRHAGSSVTKLAGEWDAIQRRPDRTIDIELYRQRIAASRRQAARDWAALTSAGVGVLAMIAIYLAMFFASAHLRVPTDMQPAAPIPNAAAAKV
jgi:hypothetical protein